MSDDPFVTHRSLLFTVAYEMLGSAADAEDVVQETWLRWDSADQAAVRDPRAYLVRIVTRQALNLLRTQARRREEYVGEWLPEPLLTSRDIAEDVEFAEHVSIAMLTVLETLVPMERAVFVLREVFDVPYGEIAEAVDKSPAAVRQIAHRARKETGEIGALMDVLAPDVVMVTDSGGFVAAVRQPIEGAERVAALLTGLARIAPDFRATPIQINGGPALLVDVPGDVPTVITATHAEGRITRIYVVRNPRKLGRIMEETVLSR